MKIDGRCLFVWRHADAGEPRDDADADFQRELSGRGRVQARDTAGWLLASLGKPFTVLSSDAPRAWQTAAFLAPPVALESLRPGRSVLSLQADLVRHWPGRDGPVVLVGHQPQLGGLLATLLGQRETPITIRKAAVWALRHRADREPRVTVIAVRDPGFLAARRTG